MNMVSNIKLSSGGRIASRSRQDGVILAVTMIVLVILLVSSVALIRSFNASIAVSGSLALRRDLMNQAERAVNRVVVANFGVVSPSAPINQAQRETNQPSFNYSACQLTVDVHGVPNILQDTDANFAGTSTLVEPWGNSSCTSTAVGSTANDITDPQGNSGIVVRYVVDRLCANTGEYTSSNCASTPISPVRFRDANTPNINSPAIPIYRISIRAKDARGATTYLQTTFSN
jgi:hypothetical protein